VTWDSSGAALVDITGVGGGIGDNQTLALTVGRMYRMLVTVRAGTYTGQLAMQVGGSTIATPTPSDSYQTFAAYFTAASTDPSLGVIRNTAATGTIFVDTFSVREVPGAHAIQATSASRPTCDARVNLLTYSEQLDNAAWSKLNSVTATANTTTAPDGTTTADTVAAGTTGSFRVVRRSPAGLLASTAMAFSVYAKRNTSDWVALRFWDQSGGVAAWFNVNTGSVGTVQSGCTATIQSIGSGWFRCIVTRTINASIAFNEAEIQLASADNSNDATAGDSLFIWGADLRIASDASLPYQRVVTASDYADVQAPRYLTFDGVDDSLYTAASVDFATWTSGTRRNLLTYPSAFNDAAWIASGASVAANNATDPTGGSTADTLTETATTADHFLRQNRTELTSSGAYTFSFYAKHNGRFVLAVLSNAVSGDAYVYFNVQTGAITQAAAATGAMWSSVAASITDAGSGWYRCTLTATKDGTGNVQPQIRLSDVGTGSSSRSYAGNGTSGVLLWGAQLELGSTATAFQDVGTDKMTVVTGVRKLSDAALGIVAELSATSATNPGVFAVFAPRTTGDFSFRAAANASPVDVYANGFAAPVTTVLTGLCDISGNLLRIRANSVTTETYTTNIGTGTFGTYVLFIGRRNNASAPFNGRIYQLIVRGAQTDTATVQQTERFVAGKTGIVL